MLDFLDLEKKFWFPDQKYYGTPPEFPDDNHLLFKDMGRSEISKSMQLVAGRVAQSYNYRKSRKGAFWEDRYHATAVATDHPFAKCLTYIDLNMVRAGVIEGPADWPESGYAELMLTKQRYNILDLDELGWILEVNDRTEIHQLRGHWIEEALRHNSLERHSCWSESLAVGSEGFVGKVKLALEHQGRKRTILESPEGYVLREVESNYGILA